MYDCELFSLSHSTQPRLYTVRTVCYILESLASVGLLISVFIIFLYKYVQSDKNLSAGFSSDISFDSFLRVPGEGYFVNICILVFIVLVQVTFMGGINRVEWGQVCTYVCIYVYPHYTRALYALNYTLKYT